MNHYSKKGIIYAIAILCFATSHAQENEIKSTIELAPFSIVGESGPFLDTAFVANQSFVTDIELEGINATTVEDSIKYLPNLNIRKRYIGDTNGVTSIRGQNTWMTGRSLVTVDGVLISNYLQTRWSGAPRWGAVSPDEIQHVEVEYGPYSAFSSGNALGGSIKLITRMPEKRESSLRTTFFSQDFRLYATNDQFDGYKVFASYGDKIGKLSLYSFYNHIENESHPQGYGDDISLKVATGSESEAFGSHLDLDPRGRERIIYGSTGSDSLVYDQFKIKTRYDFTESLQGQFSVVYWKNDSDQTNKDNYIVDVNGDSIWSGEYRYNGRVFDVKGSDFKVNRRQREDVLMGFTLGGELGSDWEFDSTLSYFDVLKDEDRSSNLNPEDPNYDGSGRVTWFDDTNWLTFDFKTGSNNFLGKGNLSFFAGYHLSDYGLNLLQSTSSKWESGTRDEVRNNTGGDSQMQALYVQGGVQLSEHWRVVGGVRQEWWDASDGYLQNVRSIAFYPSRSQSESSPKLSLDFQPSSEWKATLNLAKAYRFPLVPELFQGRINAGSIDRNNPDLKPEDALATELSLTRFTEGGQMRFTLFRDEVSDAIFNLLDTDRNLRLFLNIDEVETKGFEFVYDKRSFLHERIDLRFNASYTDSVIEENSANVAYVGNKFPRIPDWRINLFSTYRITERLSTTLGVRHQSHSFNRLENDDAGSGYGSVSEFFVVDTKVLYRMNEGTSLSIGIDNVFDEEYFVAHPYPQRTLFLDARIRF